jgi:hypothetical protein
MQKKNDSDWPKVKINKKTLPDSPNGWLTTCTSQIRKRHRSAQEICLAAKKMRHSLFGIIIIITLQILRGRLDKDFSWYVS